MLHEATKLVLGRGEVYFDRFIAGTLSGEGERYLGNTPSFQITREIERLNRATSYGGQRHDTRGAVISESLEISLVTDHMADENMSLWFSSEAVPTYAGDEFIPHTETFPVIRGRHYQLGSKVVPGGYKFVDSLVLRRGATLLLLGEDYLFDRDHGRIKILDNAPRISGTATVTATYIKRPSVFSIATSEAREVYGSLRYIARDPYGPQTDYWLPQVRITPRGAVDLKGDEFRQLSFDVTAMRLGPNHALIYALQEGVGPTPITADTALVTADTTRHRADMDAWQKEKRF